MNVLQMGPRGKSDDLFESASILFASFSIRDFPTFLKSGHGPVEFGKKAFGPSKLGKFGTAILNGLLPV